MISIIIPTLNEEDYLPLVLESVKKQSFTDYEIIVADAGSKDATLEIAKKYGAIIVPGGMPGPGRNRGAAKAVGDILLFLDADVILPEGFLAVAVEEFTRRNLGIAGFPIVFRDTNIFQKAFNDAVNFWLRLTANIVPHAFMVIMAKKSVHEKIHGFDESVLMHEDLWYALAAKKVSRYGIINKKAFTSSRRHKKDGWLATNLRYLLAEWYTLCIGPIKKDIFRYKFNHYKDKNV